MGRARGSSTLPALSWSVLLMKVHGVGLHDDDAYMPAGLARLATTFFFKDDLGLSPAETAALTGIFSLPWIIKVRRGGSQQASQSAAGRMPPVTTQRWCGGEAE